jgi:hypothetical protein
VPQRIRNFQLLASAHRTVLDTPMLSSSTKLKKMVTDYVRSDVMSNVTHSCCLCLKISPNIYLFRERAMNPNLHWPRFSSTKNGQLRCDQNGFSPFQMRVRNRILVIVVIKMREEARNDFSRCDLKEAKSRGEFLWKSMVFNAIRTNNSEMTGLTSSSSRRSSFFFVFWSTSATSNLLYFLPISSLS